MLISLAEYAKNHGRDPATCRQMALRGGFQTARKIGRNWCIDSDEPYPDHRGGTDRSDKYPNKKKAEP